MTVGASGPFPSGRTLAGWWRLLAPLEPLSVWVGHLFIHHTHALVRLDQFTPLDPLSQVLLEMLDCELRHQAGQDTLLSRMEHRLGVDRHLLLRWLGRLVEAGLISHPDRASWNLTPTGRQAREQGGIVRHQQERRSFTFVDPRPMLGPASVPFFLAIQLPPHGWMGLWTAGKKWPMDLDLLRSCPGQPLEWKQKYGFPTDVSEILMMTSENPDQEWERLIIDEPLQLCLVLCHGPATARSTWQGFAVQPEGWQMDLAQPVLTIKEGVEEILPLLGVTTSGLGETEDRQAWRNWCQGRGWTVEEADACGLELVGEALRLHPPPDLRERLVGALRGDAWLLTGSGWMRQMRKLELGTE